MANDRIGIARNAACSPPRDFVTQANIGMADFERLNAEAAADFPGFWGRLAREQLLWHKPFTKVLDESKAPFFKWFDDGELNASYNCLDRQPENGNADKIAIIFEADDGKVTKVTYKELYHRVCQFANGAQGARHQEGRPRPHLHADVDRGRGRDAGLRAHRRDALGGVRRLLGQERCRSASSTPARSR